LLEQLYNQYAESVYRICLRYVRNTQDAEDLVHEVFLRIRAHQGDFEGRSSLFTWIYRITVNECLQWLRKRRGTEGLEAADAAPGGAGPAPEVETKIVLNQILRYFDRKTKAVLFLLYLEGLTQEETAEVMQISRRAVNKNLSRFRERLARLQLEKTYG
jgi:RNA polymerase sigma factor (sigma-70 family)